ncbi:Hypothetical protein, putative [Bodo saltans]|uniref:HIT domain-containing protein n=1 Tax=Bodo saltans TaxID=75058 RepID=A0A0S4JN40_BODSA|nr:Hypothetical protein, putative [Bodo saltans]|eukprot:CUG91629.1 Hypothetical protein, putative [Bodo saltans]
MRRVLQRISTFPTTAASSAIFIGAVPTSSLTTSNQQRMATTTSRFHTTTGSDVFSKIIRGEIPSTKRYEDDFCIAFDDLSPAAPVHVLIIPKLHTRGISNLFGSGAEDEVESALPLVTEPINDAEVVGKLFAAAARVAEAIGIDKTGYRLVINNGGDAGQTVFHLHLHLLGGRELT